MNRIVFAGAGGTGKTTMTEALSKELNIPIIGVKTREHLPAGVESHLDILRMATQRPHEGIEFQSNLIRKRNELFKNHEGNFVSDRSVIDSAVYYAMHNAMFDTAEHSEELMNIAYQSIMDVDLTVILAPFLATGMPTLVDDGFRIPVASYYVAASSAMIQMVNLAAARAPFRKSGFVQLNDKPEVTGYLQSIASEAGKVSSILLINEPISMLPTKDRIDLINRSLMAIAESSVVTTAAPTSLN